MKILVVGGTSFVGRHIVEAAVHNNHQVTLFNRGVSNPDAFPELPRIMGDRKKDARKLAGHKWDAVIDTCAYTPEDLMPILNNIDTDFYVLVSTVSVYSDYKKGAPSETSDVLDNKFTNEEERGKAYGSLKVQTEKKLLETMGDRALIIRPSIVAGPYDPTGRFAFWASKLAKEGKTLIPGSKERVVQWIDARDLAAFILMQVENDTNGIFNVAADPVDMETFVAELGTGKTEGVWVDDAFLIKHGIESFEIPLWIPISEEYPEGFIVVQNAEAKRVGLVCRSAHETAKDIRKWLNIRDGGAPKAGLSREKELELLRLYELFQAEDSRG